MTNVSDEEKADRKRVPQICSAVIGGRWTAPCKVDFWHERFCQLLEPRRPNALSSDDILGLCNCARRWDNVRIVGDLLPVVQSPTE